MAEFRPRGVPPGFRFHPTDELLHCYLEKHIHGQTLPLPIPTLDVYGTAPWDLPPAFQGADGYLFCLTQRTQCTKNGKRAKRTLGSSGTWRGNKTKEIVAGGKVVGYKTFLTFQADKRGCTTGWVMHEYRLANSKYLSEFQGLVLCKIKNRQQEGSAPGKRQKMMEPDDGALDHDVGECNTSTTYNDSSIIDPVPVGYPGADGAATNDAGVVDAPPSATFPLSVHAAPPRYAPYTGDMGEVSSATPLAVADAPWQDLGDGMAPPTVMASGTNGVDDGSGTPQPRSLAFDLLDDATWMDEPIQTWFTFGDLLCNGENPDARANSHDKDDSDFQDTGATTSCNGNDMDPMGSRQPSSPAAPLPQRPTMMAAHHGTDGAPNEAAADVPAVAIRTETGPPQVVAAPPCCALTWRDDGFIGDGSMADTAAMDWASILGSLTDGVPANEIFLALMQEDGS